MKKQISFAVAALVFFSMHLHNASAAVKRPLQVSVSRGVYIHTELVALANIKKLPIPLANDDYAFYQSIGKVSNVVIGKFKTGPRHIILVSDRDANGTVDFSCAWYVDEDRIDIEPKPGDVYGPERFSQMKDEIINGQSAALSPNSEGAGYMRVLMKKPSNITRMRNGYRVSGRDPDDPTLERVSYFYSDNGVNGVDIAFHIRYYNFGTVRISPTINVGVYCKDSFDPYAVSIVGRFLTEARGAYYPGK